MSRLIIIFAALIVYSCQSKNDCFIPLTTSENAFIEEKKLKGFNVKIEYINVPYIIKNDLECEKFNPTEYNISVYNFSEDQINQTDSMRELSRKIAIHFYRDIISDQISLYTENLNIKLSTKINKSSSTIESSSFYKARFRKEDLAEFCEFLVVENNDKLIRQKVKKYREDLIIFSEQITR